MFPNDTHYLFFSQTYKWSLLCDSVLIALQILIYLISLVAIIITIVHMRKLWHEEVKEGHTAHTGQSWGSDPDSLTSELEL